MSPSVEKLTNGTHAKKDRSNLIPFSSRLKEGRALAQDVWSIFKYVEGNRRIDTHPADSRQVLPTSPRIVSISDRAT